MLIAGMGVKFSAISLRIKVRLFCLYRYKRAMFWIYHLLLSESWPIVIRDVWIQEELRKTVVPLVVVCSEFPLICAVTVAWNGCNSAWIQEQKITFYRIHLITTFFHWLHLLRGGNRNSFVLYYLDGSKVTSAHSQIRWVGCYSIYINSYREKPGDSICGREDEARSTKYGSEGQERFAFIFTELSCG